MHFDFHITIDGDRWSEKYVATHENYDGPDGKWPCFTGVSVDDLSEQIKEWYGDDFDNRISKCRFGAKSKPKGA